MKSSTSAAVAALSCTLLISCSAMPSRESALHAARSPEQVIEWSYTGTGPKGERIELSGESAELARRQSDGTWRYVIDLPMGTE